MEGATGRACRLAGGGRLELGRVRIPARAFFNAEHERETGWKRWNFSASGRHLDEGLSGNVGAPELTHSQKAPVKAGKR